MSAAAPGAGEARMAFVLALRQAGVRDPAVLEAMEAVDRAPFVTGTFADRAYEDTPLPIECGQTISQPSVVARMTEALEIGPRHTVLEVGTGSGYQAAILARLARRVYTVERHPALAARARRLLEGRGLHTVTVFAADGGLGLPAQAPFDRILVTAAAEDPPGPLLGQLREGGVMVVPVGPEAGVQTLVRVRRQGGAHLYEELADVRFVPLVEGVADG